MLLASLTKANKNAISQKSKSEEAIVGGQMERQEVSRGLLLAGTPAAQHLATRMSPLAAAAMHGDVTKVREILGHSDLDGNVIVYPLRFANVSLNQRSKCIGRRDDERTALGMRLW